MKPIPNETSSIFMKRCVIHDSLSDLRNRDKRTYCAIQYREEAHAQIYWKTIDRQRSAFFDWAEKLAIQALNASLNKYLSIRFGSVEEMLQRLVTGLTSEMVGTAIEEIHMRVGPQFALPIFNQFSKASEFAMIDEWTRRVGQILLAQLPGKILGIDNASERIISSILTSAIADGLSVQEAARNIRDKWSDANLARGLKIARTEVVGASNVGQMEGARSTGLDLKKIWVSTRDSRTRSSHVTSDQQERGLDDTFIIGGSRMMHPHDGSLGAPASEIVNCRCTVRFTEAIGL